MLKRQNLFADGRILLEIRARIRDMQDQKAYSRRQEIFLDGLREKLPKWYGLILTGEAFWYDMAVDCGKTETLGISSFPLIARRLQESGPEEEEEWEIAIRVTVGGWHIPQSAEEAVVWKTKETEQKKLLRRMGDFFCGYGQREQIRECYLQSLTEKLGECVMAMENGREKGLESGEWCGNFAGWIQEELRILRAAEEAAL